MFRLQLGEDLFVYLDKGDMFMYRYDKDHTAIKTVTKDGIPPLDEYTSEILSFYSKRHFILRRENGAYWWEEVKY